MLPGTTGKPGTTGRVVGVTSAPNTARFTPRPVATPRGQDSTDWGTDWDYAKTGDSRSRPLSEAKVVGLSQYEWTIPPSLCAAQHVSSCLRAGKQFEGNVAHVCSLSDVDLLKALWDVYQVEQGLTLILTGEAANAVGALLTRVSLTRQGRQAKLETVALLQLGTGSPCMRPVQKVKATAVTKVARCSVRIVVPSHYRLLFVDNVAKDGAQAILSDLASATGVPVHQLTGCRWELQKFGTKGSQLLGWLRVAAQVADKLTACSGRRGIFCSIPEPTGKPRTVVPLWVPKEQDESAESYWKRIEQLSRERQQAVLFRKGFGADLGFVQKPDDPTRHRCMVVELQGVPGYWQSEEVLELLQSQGWSDLTVLTRKKVQRKPVWIVRGKPAVQEQGRKSWMFDVEDASGLRSSSMRPLPASRPLAIALLCRGLSELGKTLPSLPRVGRARLRQLEAVGSLEVESAPGSTPRHAAGAQGLAATGVRPCSPKPMLLCQMAWTALRIMRPLMAGDQLIKAAWETAATVQLPKRDIGC